MDGVSDLLVVRIDGHCVVLLHDLVLVGVLAHVDDVVIVGVGLYLFDSFLPDHLFHRGVEDEGHHHPARVGAEEGGVAPAIRLFLREPRPALPAAKLIRSF